MHKESQDFDLFDSSYTVNSAKILTWIILIKNNK